MHSYNLIIYHYHKEKSKSALEKLTSTKVGFEIKKKYVKLGFREFGCITFLHKSKTLITDSTFSSL